MSKKIITLATILTSLLSLSACIAPPTSSSKSTSKSGGKGVIKIDAGGDIGAFTSTTLPPFQYNTLEKLCQEWEAQNTRYPGVSVQVLKTSNNGDRVALSTLLAAGTAPHIIYQNGLVINNDLGNGYYLNLSPYLEKENPYNQNKPWKEVYNEAELATTQASDGNCYYVDLEKNPVGFLYNKTLLKKAGVDNPEKIETFTDLITAFDTAYQYTSKRGGYYVYDSDYRWYELAMETNLFPDMVRKGDVLRVNGMDDTEEICRLWYQNTFRPLQGIDKTKPYNDPAQDYSQNRYYEYMKFIEKEEKYRAPNSLSRDSLFRKGKIAFLEFTGLQLRNFVGYLDAVNFDWGIIPFPDITTEESPNALKGVVRGTAGLASSYWVTNTAMNAGLGDACVDLLMWLTSPEQNNRLIIDHQGGIPLNPKKEDLPDYLKQIYSVYEEDVEEAKLGLRNYWGAFNVWGAFSGAFSDTFIRNVQGMHQAQLNPGAGGISIEQATYNIVCEMEKNIKDAIVDFDYKVDQWPAPIDDD